MVAVAPAQSTYAQIEEKIRRLTVSPDEFSLKSSAIQQYVNTYYNQDFPYDLKLDQMRSVYTFYTEPYVDRYPLDVNYNQGVRAPCYVDGIQGQFFKERNQFFNLYPRFPTYFQIPGTTVTGTITGIAQPTNPTQITSVSHDLITGAVITIANVVGMTQLNGNTYQITVIDANTFSLDGIDNTAYGAYISGGTWSATDQSFSFNVPGPFLRNDVTIGGVDSFGNAITISDDGEGNLTFNVPNPVVSVPAYILNPNIPGQKNINTGNPGLYNLTNIGTVNYVTGDIDFQLPPGISLATGELLHVRVAQYQTGRPYCLLFWNNYFLIRPVPKFIHKVEIETYLTPVQFLQSTDSPLLNQWWQLIAIGAAIKVLEDRQDMEGVQNLSLLYDRQEGIVLERQGVEEIFQPNITLFNSTNYAQNFGNSYGWY